MPTTIRACCLRDDFHTGTTPTAIVADSARLCPTPSVPSNTQIINDDPSWELLVFRLGREWHLAHEGLGAVALYELGHRAADAVVDAWTEMLFAARGPVEARYGWLPPQERAVMSLAARWMMEGTPPEMAVAEVVVDWVRANVR